MTDTQFLPLNDAWKPLGHDERAGTSVCIIGAGGIADFAHLQAYAMAGIPVGALYDPDPDRLARAGRNLPATTFREQRWSEMMAWLRTGRASVLDVAVPTPNHALVVSKLLDDLGADCPALLVQKPLADNYRDAVTLTQKARDLGITMALNLNARWVSSFAKVRDLLRTDAIGDVHLATIVNRGKNVKRPGEWRGSMRRLIGLEMAVHHLDLLCWWFGDAEWVFAKMANVAGFGIDGDNVATFTIGFGGVTASLLEDWTLFDTDVESLHPSNEVVVLSGASGTMVATSREVRVTTRSGEVVRYQNDRPWFPDAFAGPMLDLIRSRGTRRVPSASAESHLAVLKLIDSAYLSSDGNHVVRLADFDR